MLKNIFSSNNKDDDRLKKTSRIISLCEEEMLSLINDEENKKFLKRLTKIYEEIKYSDKTEFVDTDEVIYEEIYYMVNLPLKDMAEEEFKKASNNILSLIKKRNKEVMDLKRGEI